MRCVRFETDLCRTAFPFQYPSCSLCNEIPIDFVIDVMDMHHQLIVRTLQCQSQTVSIQHLQSYTRYAFVVYAINGLGRSPESRPLTIQTAESGKHNLEYTSTSQRFAFSSSTGHHREFNSIRLGRIHGCRSVGTRQGLHAFSARPISNLCRGTLRKLQ